MTVQMKQVFNQTPEQTHRAAVKWYEAFIDSKLMSKGWVACNLRVDDGNRCLIIEAKGHLTDRVKSELKEMYESEGWGQVDFFGDAEHTDIWRACFYEYAKEN